MARRAEYRNELKTRVRDEVYVRLKDFQKLNYIDSESQAVARLLEMLLCGIVPVSHQGVSGELDQSGPREKQA